MEKKVKYVAFVLLLLALMAICSCKTQNSLGRCNHCAIEGTANQFMPDSERVYIEKGKHELKEMRIISKRVGLWKRK